MPRVATKLAPAARGGFIARKVLPSDVKADYARLYGQATEERLKIEPMNALQARARHREWLSEIETRIANIRASRTGEGRTLTPKDARALAGEWYRWFVAREVDHWPPDAWQQYHQNMIEELQVASIANGIHDGDPVSILESNAEVRERVRPVIADEAKSEQFLAAKRLVLNPVSRALFLDFVARDFFAALSVLSRRARGDYGEDKWLARFPKQEMASDSRLDAWTLFERWIAKAKPAVSTVDRWRGVFQKIKADHPNTPAGALLPEQMQAWANGLITEQRTPYTVQNIWVNGPKTVFAWAVQEKLISRNPFTGWRIKVPKKITVRESKSFTTDEVSAILNATLGIKTRGKIDAAKRWCPWLAAYSGARMGELTQLRGVDIIEQDGIAAMKISPEAGTVKTGTTRVVPLHEHLLAQGFLDFVKASGDGPLFYNVAEVEAAIDPTNPKKPRHVKTRERVGTWVRDDVGIKDPELSPNHAWRHTFKATGDRCGMSEKVIDAIVGHAPATVGRGYGAPELMDKARELAKFPRYALQPSNGR
jgi:integrase